MAKRALLTGITGQDGAYLSQFLHSKGYEVFGVITNLVGGYLVGFAVAYFLARVELAPEWRLFAVTGFLGGLTTFSTFSAEVVELLMRGDVVQGALVAAAHLAGSLALTFAGFATFRLLAA